MKLKLILTTAIVGAALVLPGVSRAAPPAPSFQDSVSLTGAPVEVPVVPQGFAYTLIDLNATSGPSGENPSGLVRFDIPAATAEIGGPVTCLAVSGNTATITFISQPPSNFIGNFTVQVVDGQPDTFTAIPFVPSPTECSPLFNPPLGGPLLSGDITVVDAQQQPPTTTDQCKGDGWRQFFFANQGLCLAFVERGP